MKKNSTIIFYAGCLVLLLIGLLLMTGLIDARFSHAVAEIFKKPIQERWAINLHRIGFGLILLGIMGAVYIRFLAPLAPAWFKRLVKGYRQLAGRFEGWLLTFMAPSTPPSPGNLRVNRVDGWIAAAFLVFSLLFFLGRLEGNYPTVILGGDGGNIASFATAWDHPELFKGDELLNNLDNIRIYNTVHIPLIRAMHRLTGDYGLAYLLQLAPTIFTQLVGFYWLGRVLFKNRFWALLLAVVTAMPFSINLGELWGISRDPLPRFTYQAILPYLLTLTLLWKNYPRRWPWLMVIAGVLFYVHPVSAPTFGFAIWLGLWLFLPREWRWSKRVGYMLVLGGVFVLSVLPFALNYFSHHVQGSSANYEAVMTILQNYFPKNLLNVGPALADYWHIIYSSGLFIPAVLGLIVLWLILRPYPNHLDVVLLWIVGVAVVSIAIPATERTIEHYFKLLPLETELMRGLRYFVPFMLLFCIWPLSELSQRLKSRAAPLVLLALGVVFAGYWVITYQPDFDKMAQALTCMSHGKLVCYTDDQVTQEIQAIKTFVPPGDPIFAYTTGGPSFSYSLEIRYAAERPLVYSFKDRGLLGYANQAALLEWQATNQSLEAIEKIPGQENRLEPLIKFAQGLKAQYLLVDFNVSQDVIDRYHLSRVYGDDQSTLLDIRQ